MWPWGHLAVGYLLYSGWLRWRDKRPKSPEVFAIALGTLLPDLIDKPLAWHLGILEAGRSLGHSLLVAGVIIGLLFLVFASRFGTSTVVAFAAGYVSHPLADLPFVELLTGDFANATYLLWPLLPPPVSDVERSIIARIINFHLGPYETFQVALFVIAGYVWYVDGAPGYREARKWYLARVSTR